MSRAHATNLLGVALGCALTLVGCADTDVDPVTTPLVTDAGSFDATQPDAALGCKEGALQSCACSSRGAGTQTCTAGSFGACQGCVGSQAKCVAGNYVGKGTGTQRPTILPGVVAPFTVERETDWSFSLATMGSSEFYTVGNGCIHVIEPEQQVDNGSSRAYITGNVDCSTGKLDGEIKGFYSVAMGVKVYYKGTLQGTFDPATNSFVNTKYNTSEPKVALDPQPGGDGVWTAKLTDAAPSSESEEACLMGPFPHDSFK